MDKCNLMHITEKKFQLVMFHSSPAVPFFSTRCMLGMKVQPLLHHGMCS